MTTATLRQEFFLSPLPEGLKLTVTSVNVMGNRGYNSGWRDIGSFNLNKTGPECYSGGRAAQKTMGQDGSLICSGSTNFSPAASRDGQPTKIGEMTWQKSTIESIAGMFGRGEPGYVELKFQVNDTKSGKVLAAGTLTGTPDNFGFFQRPDNVNVQLKWDRGIGGQQQTSTQVAPNIGVDPPQIHLGFALSQDGKRLAMGFKQVQSTLNNVASLGVQAVLDVNKALIEWGVPGGAVILAAIELPGTIDTAIGLAEQGKAFVEAIQSGDPRKMHIALLQLIRSGYDLGGVIMTLVGAKSDIAKKVLEMVPPGAKDLGEGVLTKLIEDILTKAMDAQDKSVNGSRPEGAPVINFRARRRRARAVVKE